MRILESFLEKFLFDYSLVEIFELFDTLCDINLILDFDSVKILFWSKKYKKKCANSRNPHFPHLCTFS